MKNPAIYAASLHYFMQMMSPNSKTFTQKEIADLYDVSKGRISEIYLEIRYVVINELQKIEMDANEDVWESEFEEDFDWDLNDELEDELHYLNIR